MYSSSWNEADAEKTLSQRLQNLQPISNWIELDEQFVTWSEYFLFLKETKQDGHDYSPEHWLGGSIAVRMADPAIGLTAQQAQAFCDWLSEREGKHFRLPRRNEAQQRVAVRHDVTTWCKDDGLYSLDGLTSENEPKLMKQLRTKIKSKMPSPRSLAKVFSRTDYHTCLDSPLLQFIEDETTFRLQTDFAKIVRQIPLLIGCMIAFSLAVFVASFALLVLISGVVVAVAGAIASTFLVLRNHSNTLLNNIGSNNTLIATLIFSLLVWLALRIAISLVRVRAVVGTLLFLAVVYLIISNGFGFHLIDTVTGVISHNLFLLVLLIVVSLLAWSSMLTGWFGGNLGQTFGQLMLGALWTALVLVVAVILNLFQNLVHNGLLLFSLISLSSFGLALGLFLVTTPQRVAVSTLSKTDSWAGLVRNPFGAASFCAISIFFLLIGLTYAVPVIILVGLLIVPGFSLYLFYVFYRDLERDIYLKLALKYIIKDKRSEMAVFIATALAKNAGFDKIVRVIEQSEESQKEAIQTFLQTSEMKQAALEYERRQQQAQSYLTLASQQAAALERQLKKKKVATRRARVVKDLLELTVAESISNREMAYWQFATDLAQIIYHGSVRSGTGISNSFQAQKEVALNLYWRAQIILTRSQGLLFAWEGVRVVHDGSTRLSQA